MELKIKKQVEETVNITFPHFTKSICTAFCFESEDECTAVNFGVDKGIEIKSSYPIDWLGEDEVISEEEFELIFNEVLEKIKNKSRG